MSDKLEEAQEFITEWGYCPDNFIACNVKQFINKDNEPDDNSIELCDYHEEMLKIIVSAGLRVNRFSQFFMRGNKTLKYQEAQK